MKSTVKSIEYYQVFNRLPNFAAFTELEKMMYEPVGKLSFYATHVLCANLIIYYILSRQKILNKVYF